MSNTRIRVWQIAELYPPYYGGGAAIYVRDISRLLVERGHDVRVLTADATEATPYSVRTEIIDDVRVDRVNLGHIRSRDPGAWHLRIRGWREHSRRVEAVAEKLLRDWCPDIVNVHTPYSLYEECLPVISRREIPVIALAHCAWLVCPRLTLMRSPENAPCRGPGALRCLECLYTYWDGTRTKAMLKLPWRLLKLGAYPAYRLLSRYRARRHVRGVMANSEFMRVAHHPYIRGRVIHIPLGIDLTGLPIDKPHRPRTPFRFGFAGGGQKAKGIGQILDVIRSLRRRELRFELHIWGPEEHVTRAEIHARALEDCVFVRGMFGVEDKWAAFGEMDVLVMATQVLEPYGRVIQEAAAMGAPSIAPRIGGMAEQIRDDVDGLLYRFRDAADLERQAARVLLEPGLFGRLAANLWSVIDTRDAVQEIERYYVSVLSRTSSSTSTPTSSANLRRKTTPLNS